MIRTHIISSNTYVWRDGFSDWQMIFQVDDLKELIMVTNTEVQDSITRNKIMSKVQKGDVYSENFYLGGDSYWHVYDLISKTWSKQEEVIFKLYVYNRNH